MAHDDNNQRTEGKEIVTRLTLYTHLWEVPETNEEDHLVNVLVSFEKLARQIEVFVERAGRVTQIGVQAFLQRIVVDDLRPKLVMRKT